MCIHVYKALTNIYSIQVHICMYAYVYIHTHTHIYKAFYCGGTLGSTQLTSIYIIYIHVCMMHMYPYAHTYI